MIFEVNYVVFTFTSTTGFLSSVLKVEFWLLLLLASLVFDTFGLLAFEPTFEVDFLAFLFVPFSLDLSFLLLFFKFLIAFLGFLSLVSNFLLVFFKLLITFLGFLSLVSNFLLVFFKLFITFLNSSYPSNASCDLFFRP